MTIPCSADNNLSKGFSRVPLRLASDGWSRLTNETLGLLGEWPTIMRDLASAESLKIWLQDSSEINQEIDVLAAGSVGAVATVNAWGYSFGF